MFLASLIASPSSCSNTSTTCFFVRLVFWARWAMVADLLMGFAIRWSSVSGLRVNDRATADDRGCLGQGRIVTHPSALVNNRLVRRYDRLGVSVFSGCTKRNWLDAESA